MGLGRARSTCRPQEARERGEPGIFWAAHQADLPYSQIERLANLGDAAADGLPGRVLPAQDRGGSAAPARVVALVP